LDILGWLLDIQILIVIVIYCLIRITIRITLGDGERAHSVPVDYAIEWF